MENDPDVLWFRSRSSVSATDASALSAQARSAGAGWAGPLWVLAPRSFLGRHLVGHQRLWLREYESPAGRFRTVAPADDRAMACGGLRAAVAMLADWGRLHGVQWDLRLGNLKAQIPDGPSLAQLENAACSGAPGADPAEIARRYPDRPR
jgi:hypothetical protein